MGMEREAAMTSMGDVESILDRAIDRFLATDYEELLRDQLTGGEGFTDAVWLLLHRDMRGFVDANIDAVLPLIIEGGVEAVPLEKLVLGALRRKSGKEIRDFVRPLVDRVTTCENSNSYNEYNGLLQLLNKLCLYDWLVEVTLAARQCSTDADVAELAEDYADLVAGFDASVWKAKTEAYSPSASRNAVRGEISKEARASWLSFVNALHVYRQQMFGSFH